MIGVPSRVSNTIPLRDTRVRSQGPLPGVSCWVRREDLRVEAAGELAFQRGPQVGEGRALDVLRSRLVRLVLLDHDQPVGSLEQRVEFDAWFVVNPGDRRLEGRDYLGAVLGDGKGRDDLDNAHVGCSPPVDDHPFRGVRRVRWWGWSYL